MRKPTNGARALRGLAQQLLELIDDQQRLGLADRQIAADRISGLARVGESDALAQSGALLRRAAEPLGRLGHTALEALDRIAAGSHDDDVPEPVVGLAAGHFGELAAAKRRDEASLRERGLARAAVRHDGDQAVRLELVNELADLLVAAEEPVRIRFGHRLEPDEGVLENDGLLGARPSTARSSLANSSGLLSGSRTPWYCRANGGSAAAPAHSADRIGIKGKFAPAARDNARRTSDSTQFTTPLAPIWTANAVACSVIAFSS